MNQRPDPTRPPTDDDDREQPSPAAVDEVVDAADDPGSDKERTGDAQAAVNRDEDPPA